MYTPSLDNEEEHDNRIRDEDEEGFNGVESKKEGDIEKFEEEEEAKDNESDDDGITAEDEEQVMW
jgi:hypothetical protein